MQALDLKIVRCLQHEPRTTNKAVGRAVGVTEQTVASRIRALTDGGVMRVMAQRDLAAAGYPEMAFVGLWARSGAIDAVARAAAAITETLSVVLCPGSPEVIVTVVGQDSTRLGRSIAAITAIDGVTAVDVITCTGIHVFRTGAGNLATEIGPPLPAMGVDPLDEAVIGLLVEDGRLSNREIARRTDVSEGSIRLRLKRLAERRAMKLGVVCEPDKVGYAHGAYILIGGATAAVDGLLDSVRHDDITSFAAATSGGCDGLLVCTAPSERDIMRLCIERLRTTPGIERVAYRPIHLSLKHRYDYVMVGDQAHLAGSDYLVDAHT